MSRTWYEDPLPFPGDRVYNPNVAASAESSESEILHVALELVLRLVAYMERVNPAGLDEFLDLLQSISVQTDGED